VRVGVVGCGHGELDAIYSCVRALAQRDGVELDLLIVCGDFQSVRNYSDLKAMACPEKYRKLNTFYKYYAGEAVAPVLTIFIGGNHEASNYLVELSETDCWPCHKVGKRCGVVFCCLRSRFPFLPLSFVCSLLALSSAAFTVVGLLQTSTTWVSHPY
jgi:hypothetical protein